MTIPCSLVELIVPLDSLRNLPSGAIFSNRQGQATAALGMKGNSIVAYAYCDSLQQLVYTLEESLRQARDALIEKETVKEPIGITLGQKLKWCLIGVFIGICISVIFKRLKTICQEKQEV